MATFWFVTCLHVSLIIKCLYFLLYRLQFGFKWTTFWFQMIQLGYKMIQLGYNKNADVFFKLFCNIYYFESLVLTSLKPFKRWILKSSTFLFQKVKREMKFGHF
jgi:hypothetical protein